jgi:hypothetical protein
MMRRLDRADFGFINHPFGVNQRFVQVEQRVAQLLERLPHDAILRFFLFDLFFFIALTITRLRASASAQQFADCIYRETEHAKTLFSHDLNDWNGLNQRNLASG